MKNSNGFTLVEVVIAIAIISISLVTLISIMNTNLATAAESAVLTEAVMLASEKITLKKDLLSPQPGISGWETDERYPRFSYQTIVTEIPNVRNALLVTLRVRHDDKDVFSLDGYAIK